MFLQKKTCKHEIAVLYLQKLHFLCGLNELLLEIGRFLHRLPLSVLKPAAQLWHQSKVVMGKINLHRKKVKLGLHVLHNTIFVMYILPQW